MFALNRRICACLVITGIAAVPGCTISREDALGSVSLSLTGQGASGVLYKLRDATVTVEGPTSTTVWNTEDDPNRASLSADVAAGDYSATLGAGWRLERVDGVPVANATLVSDNPARFTVATHQRTSVPLRFQVSGDTVDMTQGYDIVITVEDVTCGDGIVERAQGEECDPGPLDSATCNSRTAGGVSCKFARCGDGYANAPAGEQCDVPGGSDATFCNGSGAGPVSCHLSSCGDGYANAPAGEQCDVPGGSDATFCNGSGAGPVSCHLSSCGDGYANALAGESCDVGTADTSTCNGSVAGVAAARCQFAQCGDRYVNRAAGEQCEASNGTDSRTCNGKNAGVVACHAAICGDGYVNRAAGEMCESDADCAAAQTCNACVCR